MFSFSKDARRTAELVRLCYFLVRKHSLRRYCGLAAAMASASASALNEERKKRKKEKNPVNEERKKAVEESAAKG